MPLGTVFSAARRLRVQFALIIALAMAPAGLVAVIQAASNIEEAIQNDEDRLRKTAWRISENERVAVLAIREKLRLGARSADIRSLGGAACDEALEGLIRNDSRFSGAMLFNRDGVSVCGPEKGFDISQAAVFRDFVDAPRIMVGPVRVGSVAGRNMMLALAPVLGDDDSTGVLAMGLAADFFQNLAAGSTTGETRLALLDETGTVFAENTSGQRDWLPGNLTPFLASEERFVTLESRDGTYRSFYFSPMPIDRFWMVAAKPRLSWGAMLLSDKGLQLVTPLLLWAIAVGVAFFVIDRLVSRHIVYLQRVATTIGRGNLAVGRLRTDGAPYEIKRLGDALETMSSRLAEREASLRANIEAKRALLLEVHHRVKNNLQMISSLMNMQIRRVEGTNAQRSMQIVQDRIHGLALVHQHLYAADRLDAVALDRLVEDLAVYLRSSLCPPGGHATFEFDLAPTHASADVATPVALFLTEAVSNAFKHSWTTDTTGTLSIRLAKGDGDTFVLSVRNDRPADLPAQADDPDGGLGTRLMKGFAQQIGGTLTYDISRESYLVELTAPRHSRSQNFAVRGRGRATGQDAQNGNSVKPQTVDGVQ